MAGHGHGFQIPFDTNERFVVPSRLRLISFVLMALGVVGIVLGFMMGGDNENPMARGWLNLLVNNIFFLYLALTGIFFIAFNYMANAGWSAGIKRIPEAMGAYVPVAGVSILVILAIMLLGDIGPIYHWAHEGITDPNSPHYDAVIAKKSAYLNLPFFFARIAIAFAAWTFFWSHLRKLSVQEDEIGGLRPFKHMRTASAIFVVVFGVTFCMLVWDIVMSIDTHWFSTIFVFYNFTTMLVSGISTIMVILVLLQRAGYMKGANSSHLHDLGKMMFGFSIFWTYQWVSQFLLYWYANIPEESVYYAERIYSSIRPYFWINLIVNFVLPLLIFMTRESKRNHTTIIPVAIIILCGHWLDIFLMFEVGIMGESLQIGIPEVLTLAGYAGLFTFVVSRALAKVNLYPVKHPYLREFAFHDI